MRKWVMPAAVGFTLLWLTDYLGLHDEAWWLIPLALFPVALAAMVVRKELTIGAVAMLLILSGVLATILKFGA
jgi:hypothetical protein